ncbi:hypothetical protein BH09SUM1_BH09SUM1_02340 [soil metagenome]
MTPQFLKPRNTLLFFSVLSLVIGGFLRHAGLIAFGVAGVGALVIAFVQAYGLLSGVRVQRLHHPRAFQGSSVAVNLQVAGEDDRAPELLLVEDSFPPSSTSRIRRLVEHPLKKGNVIEINFVGSCDHRRGRYILGPVRLQAADGYGFFTRELIMESFTELLVYPLAVELRSTKLLGEGTLAHVGLEMSRRSGLSEEFAGVRDYRPGDPPRLVHWKSTARHGKLMVKEFQEEITTLVSLFIDMGKLGLVGVGDQTSVEYGVKSCASIAKRTIELGHRLQFFGVGEKVDHIPPGAGTVHLLTVLDRLSLLRAQGDSAFAIVVGDLARELPRGSTAVAIMGATTIQFDAMERALAIMLDRHILPIIVLVDDRAFIKIYREQEMAHVKAASLEEITRRLTLLGARVHVIRRAKTIEQALIQGLEQETYA